MCPASTNSTTWRWGDAPATGLATRSNWGITASSQEVSDEKQKLLGLDLTYRHSDNSYLKLETARSDGLALSAQSSVNGGYNFDPLEGDNNLVKANAYRVESAVAFSDLGLSNRGLGQFYWQQKEAGYHGLGQITLYDTDQVGANLSWGLSEDTDLRLKLDNREEDGGIDQLRCRTEPGPPPGPRVAAEPGGAFG